MRSGSKKKLERTSFFQISVVGCRFLYIVGIQSIRISKRARKRIQLFFLPVSSFAKHLYSSTLGEQLHRIRHEIASIRDGFNVAKTRLSHARHESFGCAVLEFFQIVRRSFVLHRNFVYSCLNFAVPVLSILLLFSVIHFWNGVPFGLVLTNKGETIASIESESIYEKAAEMVNQRMVHNTDQTDVKIDFKPVFQLTTEVPSGYATAEAVCDRLIKQSNGIIEEGCGLYVDGKFQGAVKSSADMRYILQNFLNSAKGNDTETIVKFSQNVETVNGLFPTAALISTNQMEKTIGQTKNTVQTYTVQKGDTVSSIAKANHMTISELNALNHNQLGDSIHLGDLIVLKVGVPMLSVELIKTLTYEQEIPYKTITQNDDTKYTDYSKIVINGVNGKQRCTDKVYSINGVDTKRNTISKVTLLEPVNKVVLTGTKKKPKNQKGIATGKLMWPIPSIHTITSYFAWRWGKFHTGIDISGSNAYGKIIVAADGGVVTLAGKNDGYGNCVIINHRNGIKTLYGHCSSLLVSAGQQVSKGQAIAKIGSSGHSTGPHCHFEVIKNGQKVNPLRFVSP